MVFPDLNQTSNPEILCMRGEFLGDVIHRLSKRGMVSRELEKRRIVSKVVVSGYETLTEQEENFTGDCLWNKQLMAQNEVITKIVFTLRQWVVPVRVTMLNVYFIWVLMFVDWSLGPLARWSYTFDDWSNFD